jgi:tetratricopeptide (TPR) repeat protein
MAISYHHLGNTAQLRGRLDEADEWYRRSLAIEEELGNRPGMALSYAQLGLLAEQQGQASSSLEWAIRCVILFDPFPHPATRPGALHLARLTLQLGMPALEEAWRQVTGNPVPQAVRDYVTSQHNEGYGSES